MQPGKEELTGVIVTGGDIREDFALAFLEEIFGRDIRFLQGRPCARLIAADRGLLFCRMQKILPGNIVGDFDSAREGILEEYRAYPEITVHRYAPEKDWTDTEIAVRLALRLGWKQIYVLGGTGSRLDHVLGNLQVMELALEEGAHLHLADEHNHIRMFRRVKKEENRSDRNPKRETFSGSNESEEMSAEEEWPGADRSSAAAIEIGKDTPWHRALRALPGGEAATFLSLVPWAGEVRGVTLRGFHYPLTDHTLRSAQSLGISNELAEQRGTISFLEGTLLVIESRD